jgi:hypothetical protein
MKKMDYGISKREKKDYYYQKPTRRNSKDSLLSEWTFDSSIMSNIVQKLVFASTFSCSRE